MVAKEPGNPTESGEGNEISSCTKEGPSGVLEPIDSVTPDSASHAWRSPFSSSRAVSDWQRSQPPRSPPSSSCPSAGADAYADLTDQTNYAYDDSRCLKELGIPVPGNNYRPDDLMTRSEMARFMARTYAIVTGNDAPVVATNFTDISADPNADDIARIFGLEITTGTTPTTYSPNSPVIRGHMALFLARLYKKATGTDAPTADTPFTDISNRSPEQETAIGQIYRLDVTTGTSDTTYSPGDDVTRRQMASFVARIYRVLDAITDQEPSAVTTDAPTDTGSRSKDRQRTPRRHRPRSQLDRYCPDAPTPVP